ncbi:histidine phosphatase family protein [Candidatus Woesearchaeota archaeon]|nr:histidine phosphatase family protein [Candidatus Woesearchaeota archaeon]
MENIYIARHCETWHNRNRVFQGIALDAPLTPEGRQETRRLAERFRNVHLDVLLCGSAARHFDTAIPIGGDAVHHPGLEVLIDPNLNERDHGDLNGQSYAHLVGDTPPAHPNTHHFLYHNDNREHGEPFSHVHGRALRIKERLKQEFAAKDVFVMSSGLFITVLCAALEGLDVRYREQHSLHNGHIHHYEQAPAGVFVPRGYNLLHPTSDHRSAARE